MNWSMLWGCPENIKYLPLLVAVALVLMYRVTTWRAAIIALSGRHNLSAMVQHSSFTRYTVKSILLFLGLVFLLLALLQPQWREKELAVAQEGRDLFVALDISRSMLAQDCAPNRLACAKNKIKSLIRHLSCERVGLILFSGSTFVQCPLTSDYAAFDMFLDQIDVETISSGSTALDQAVKQALRSFKATGSQRKSKLLVIVTDGEDFSSNLTGVKQEACQEGMSIFALGVGTAQGSPIPLFDPSGRQNGHQTDAHGAVVISRLDEGILRSLTSDCGGHYLAITKDNSDIQMLVSWVQQFEKEKYEDRKISRFEQQYHYCAAASFVCLALEWLL